MTVVYKARRRLTIEAERGRSPDECLQHVKAEADRVFGCRARLIACEINADKFIGNAWSVTATFEEDPQ